MYIYFRGRNELGQDRRSEKGYDLGHPDLIKSFLFCFLCSFAANGFKLRSVVKRCLGGDEQKDGILTQQAETNLGKISEAETKPKKPRSWSLRFDKIISCVLSRPKVSSFHTKNQNREIVLFRFALAMGKRRGFRHHTLRFSANAPQSHDALSRA